MIQGLIDNFNSAVSEYQALLTQVEDLKNQILTAELRYQNDQKALADLQAQLTQAQADLAYVHGQLKDATFTISEQSAEIKQLQAQLAALPQAVVVYDRLESKPWKANTDKSVGGSGLGTGGWKAPSVESAELWILDQAGIPAPNYVDCYFTQRVPTDGAKTHFKLEASFLFPTAADIAACQCLEFEIRQVTDDKKMVILAGQLQYSGGAYRYFDWVKRAWLPTGVTITRPAPLTWVSVGLEGHRDAVNVYYDAITFNGVRTPFTQSYALLATDWSPLLWAALQLDDTSAVNGYRVKVDGVKLTVS